MREMPLDRSLAFTALLDHDPTPERVTELLTAWYAQDETLDLWAFAREWLGIRNPRSWNRTDRIVCENTVHLEEKEVHRYDTGPYSGPDVADWNSPEDSADDVVEYEPITKAEYEALASTDARRLAAGTGEYETFEVMVRQTVQVAVKVKAKNALSAAMTVDNVHYPLPGTGDWEHTGDWEYIVRNEAGEELYDGDAQDS